MIDKPNRDIRCYMIERNVKICEVAANMGIYPSSLSRMLANDDMRPSKKAAIMKAIDRVAEWKAEHEGQDMPKMKVLSSRSLTVDEWKAEHEQ